MVLDWEGGRAGQVRAGSGEEPKEKQGNADKGIREL